MLLSTQRKIKLVRWHNGIIHSINGPKVVSRTFLLLYHLDIIGNIVTTAFHPFLGKTSQGVRRSLLACLEKECLLVWKMFEALRFIYLDWPFSKSIFKKCFRISFPVTERTEWRALSTVLISESNKERTMYQPQNHWVASAWCCYCFLKLICISAISVAILWKQTKIKQKMNIVVASSISEALDALTLYHLPAICVEYSPNWEIRGGHGIDSDSTDSRLTLYPEKYSRLPVCK